MQAQVTDFTFNHYRVHFNSRLALARAYACIPQVCHCRGDLCGFARHTLQHSKLHASWLTVLCGPLWTDEHLGAPLIPACLQTSRQHKPALVLILHKDESLKS
jgi:hypothetical protein